MDCSLTLDLRPKYKPKRATWGTHIKVILVSLLGGVFATASAALIELSSGTITTDPASNAVSVGLFAVAVVFVAPVTEELFKVIGVYLALVKWPYAMGSRLYRALLCAGAGVVFGLIESVLYLNVGARHHPHSYEVYRLTVPLAAHAVASYTVGLGLDRRIVGVVNRGDPLPKSTRQLYLAGVTIHAMFNAAVTLLAVVGVLEFN